MLRSDSVGYLHPVKKLLGHESLIDVLDRILDKGIVFDASVRATFVAIDLRNDARLRVTQVDVYLEYWDRLEPQSKQRWTPPTRHGRPSRWPSH